MSHPVRGAWIEMFQQVKQETATVSSHPVRGAWIEISTVSDFDMSYLSHPVRGAWIEILESTSVSNNAISRTPSGVRGLKYYLIERLVTKKCRTPSGVRGLKSLNYTKH